MAIDERVLCELHGISFIAFRPVNEYLIHIGTSPLPVDEGMQI